MKMSAVLAICLVFLGCCSNVVFLELIIKEDPGAGNLITFAQFLFIAVEGFIFTTKFGTSKRHIGFNHYVVLVVMFFAANICNNYAFNFNVPMPLHIIFRSGSLITNMMMGILILKKKYTFSKYLSVGMITFGIIICTIVSGQEVKSTATRGPPTTPYEDFFWWTIGIALLVAALVITARMGLYQETLFQKYGKHPQEALFYTHLLPLPGFLLLYSNIIEHFWYIFESDNIPGINVPSQLVWLVGNVVSQYMCIASVFTLSSECSSLTVHLVITLRKFFNLIFSIIYFKNPFTIYHWIGTILVFVGTLIFTEVYQNLRARVEKKDDKVKTN